MPVSIVPVSADGKAVLYDIYVDGEWVGSRRTIGQCHEFVGSGRSRLDALVAEVRADIARGAVIDADPSDI